MTERAKDRSICSLIRNREAYSPFSPNAFERGVSRYFQSKELLVDPEIISPHTSAITSLSVDRSSVGRFLLAGSADGTVSIFDLSKWGSEHFLNGNGRERNNNNNNNNISNNNDQSGRTAYHPIARSIKVPNLDSNGLDIPTGHSSSVTHVQWYPVDTGAFVSAANDGNVLFWDTEKMESVLSVNPYPNVGGVGSVHLQTGGNHSLIATGSWNHPVLKLVDIRSGSHSHELIGHDGGISAVQWSPTMPVIVASGSRDGSIRLWDIRKSGSRACITVLNQESTRKERMQQGGGYKADYSHLRVKEKKTKKRKLMHHENDNNRGGPNNYQNETMIRSHSVGHISAISFFPCGQFLTSIGGVRGDLLLWDLKKSNSLVPSKFISSQRGNACTTRQRRNALKIVDRTIWVGNQFHVQGYCMSGGLPTQLLKGHLSTVTSIEQMEPSKTLITGSSDGMILCWGKPKAIVPRIHRNEDADNW